MEIQEHGTQYIALAYHVDIDTKNSGQPLCLSYLGHSDAK